VQPEAQDQSAVFALLGDQATYGLSVPVERIDTHAAAVFLAGADAYKVKRAVRFPFMDLSTLALRRAACEAELAVNRRFAPDLYLGLVPVSRGGDGRLGLGGQGEAVEWTVHMRRFDEKRTLDRLADAGELDAGLMEKVAACVADSLDQAPLRDGAAATEALAGVVEETMSALLDAPELFAPARASAFAEAMRATFRGLRPLLIARGAAGRVRRCHGDLHLRNIVLIKDRPVLFDAIEFDESIAVTDVLYDLAFLIMDLWERGLRPQANLLLNRYLWSRQDLEPELDGLALLPPMLALRAAVRAKVEGLRHRDVDHSDAVRQGAVAYFDAATAFLARSQPRLVGIGGLSGTGKSTLAAALAPGFGRAPGAVHLRSDIERKRLFGAGEYDRLPERAYAPGVNETVFANLRRQAAIALAAGQSVIVDAVHRRPQERQRLAEVAARVGAPFTGLWLDLPLAEAAARIAGRRRDASDATPAVLAAQHGGSEGAMDWTRIDAGGGPGETAATALRLVAG
jgi:aminoglycoside phosphotransferase family enzyme/predicted kinase